MTYSRSWDSCLVPVTRLPDTGDKWGIGGNGGCSKQCSSSVGRRGISQSPTLSSAFGSIMHGPSCRPRQNGPNRGMEEEMQKEEDENKEEEEMKV